MINPYQKKLRTYAWEYAVENKLVDKIEKFIEPLYFFYIEKARYQEGKLIFDIAESALRNLQTKSGLLLYSKILARIGGFYLSIGFFKESRECFEKSLLVFKKFNLEKEIVMVYKHLAVIYHYLGEYTKSKEFLKKALKIAQKLNDRYEIAGLMNNMGMVYWITQKYDIAEELYKKSFEIWKEINYKKGIALSLGNLGLLFQDKKDYEKADEFLKKSLELEIKLENRLGIARTYYNIGRNYKFLGDHKKAKEYYKKALEIQMDIGNRMGIALSLIALADLSLKIGNYREAKNLSIKAFELSKEIGDPVIETQALLNLGESLIQKRESDKGIKYIYDSLKKAIKFNLYYYIKNGLFISADCFIIKKIYETALKILIYLKKNYKEEFGKEINKKIVKLKPTPEILKKFQKEVINKNLKDFAKEVTREIDLYLKK